MDKLYTYVGPSSIKKATEHSPLGQPIRSVADLVQWLNHPSHEQTSDGSIVVTFVIDLEQVFRVAHRRSEHVACAGGSPVYSAGEATFCRDGEIVEISNQSTGFCPEPESWTSVQDALDKIPILHPGNFTRKVNFRLCIHCHQRNIVKDNWFVCAVCESELPLRWNFSDRKSKNSQSLKSIRPINAKLTQRE